jgi:hypothetical protein
MLILTKSRHVEQKQPKMRLTAVRDTQIGADDKGWIEYAGRGSARPGAKPIASSVVTGLAAKSDQCPI